MSMTDPSAAPPSANDFAAALAQVTGNKPAAVAAQPAAAPAADPAAAAPPAAAPAAQAAVADGQAAAPPATDDPEMFPREYVKQLREEAAGLRTAAAPFQGLHAEDHQILGQVAQAIKSGNMEAFDQWVLAVAEARGLVESDAPGEPEPTAGAGLAEEISQATGLTEAQVQAMIDRRLQEAAGEWTQQQQQQAQRSAAVQAINSEFAALQIDPNSEMGTMIGALAQRMCRQLQRWVGPKEAYEAYQRAANPSPNPPTTVPPVPPTMPAGGVPGTVPKKYDDPAQAARARIDAYMNGTG